MVHQLTPEQIALSLARKKKKEEAAAAAATAPKESPSAQAKIIENPAAKVLKRDWLYGGSGRSDATILVATWNILAQILEETYLSGAIALGQLSVIL